MCRLFQASSKYVHHPNQRLHISAVYMQKYDFMSKLPMLYTYVRLIEILNLWVLLVLNTIIKCHKSLNTLTESQTFERLAVNVMSEENKL